MYPTFVRIFLGRNFYSRMPFLTPICITDQESSPLVAFYDRMAASVPSKIFVSQLVSKKCRQDQKKRRRPF